MSIPDYQQLMRPVLLQASNGEIAMKDAVQNLAEEFALTDEDLKIMLPSKAAPMFYNRVAWAKTYLNKAGLISSPARGVFQITEKGRDALKSNEVIDNKFLKKFDSFNDFQSTGKKNDVSSSEIVEENSLTPEELLRKTHQELNDAIGLELLDAIRSLEPAFFEHMLIKLLMAMGYGGAEQNEGVVLAKSGDNGVDGVIDQDPLGVDQVYIQAKRYAEGNNIGSDSIRDFFGALNLKKAQKGIFFTTSDFTVSAKETANNLSNRIVLINGVQLSKLMIRYNVGCQTEYAIEIKQIDEDFFNWGQL